MACRPAWIGDGLVRFECPSDAPRNHICDCSWRAGRRAQILAGLFGLPVNVYGGSDGVRLSTWVPYVSKATRSNARGVPACDAVEE